MTCSGTFYYVRVKPDTTNDEPVMPASPPHLLTDFVSHRFLTYDTHNTIIIITTTPSFQHLFLLYFNLIKSPLFQSAQNCNHLILYFYYHSRVLMVAVTLIFRGLDLTKLMTFPESFNMLCNFKLICFEAKTFPWMLKCIGLMSGFTCLIWAINPQDLPVMDVAPSVHAWVQHIQSGVPWRKHRLDSKCPCPWLHLVFACRVKYAL